MQRGLRLTGCYLLGTAICDLCLDNMITTGLLLPGSTTAHKSCLRPTQDSTICRFYKGISSVMTTPGSSAAQVMDFLTLVQSLKLVKRTGWVRKGIEGPESIADHMYRMGVMAMIVDDDSVNANRCMQLALAHDIAEAIVGDIAPGDGISKEEKNRQESAAMDRIRGMLGQESVAGRTVRELWQEYEDNQTPEAKLVKDFDKVEMILQAHEYEEAQGADLEEFFASTKGKFQTDLGKAWAAEIVSRRDSRTQKNGKTLQQQ